VASRLLLKDLLDERYVEEVYIGSIDLECLGETEAFKEPADG
jgi:hypothetical protein